MLLNKIFANCTINAIARVMQCMFHSRRVNVRRQFLVVTLLTSYYYRLLGAGIA